MTNTRAVVLVLTVLNHFHLFPLGPLAQIAEGLYTYFVEQSKRGWPISPKWFLAGAAVGGEGCASDDAGPGFEGKDICVP